MEGIGSVVHTVGQTIKDDSVYVLLETKMEKRPTRHHAKRKQSYRCVWMTNTISMKIVSDNSQIYNMSTK
jgi:hypothetical protein